MATICGQGLSYQLLELKDSKLKSQKNDGFHQQQKNFYLLIYFGFIFT